MEGLEEEACYILVNMLNERSICIFKQHFVHNPYPTRDEKVALSLCSGKTFRQVETWFTNARRRS